MLFMRDAGAVAERCSVRGFARGGRLVAEVVEPEVQLDLASEFGRGRGGAALGDEEGYAVVGDFREGSGRGVGERGKRSHGAGGGRG